MIVDFPAPEGPISAVTLPGRATKLTSCKTGEGIDRELRIQFGPLEEALAAMGVAVWPMGKRSSIKTNQKITKSLFLQFSSIS